MKQNQKGFTLIELLAVIVILAVIALIATPIILNTVNESRIGAAKDSAYGAIEAVKLTYSQNLLDSNPVTEATVTFGDTNTEKIGIRDVVISGTKPTGGTIKVSSDGTVQITDDLIFTNYKCYHPENDEGEIDINTIKCE